MYTMFSASSQVFQQMEEDYSYTLRGVLIRDVKKLNIVPLSVWKLLWKGSFL